MKRGVRFVPDDLTTLCARYRAGVSGSRLAAELGVSKHTVYRLLKGQGERLRLGGRPVSKADPEAVAALYAQGLTTTAIGRAVGCHRKTVMRILVSVGAISSAPRSHQKARTPPKAKPRRRRQKTTRAGGP